MRDPDPTEAPVLRVGVIGARSMVATSAVLPAIAASRSVELVAACSLGGAVASPWRNRSVATYEDVIEHPDVQAVYVPLPNGIHRTWVERCAAAGKHVLCEKPLASTPEDARAMADACAIAGVLLAEAWMTPFDPRWAHTLDLARNGTIGTPTSVDARFTFRLRPDDVHNYRWRPDQGGGAWLDVGIYCLGAAVELFGPNPDRVDLTRHRHATGVDAATDAHIVWPGGATATARASFVDDEAQTLTITGSTGSLHLAADAFTGGPGAQVIVHRDAAGNTHEILVDAADPYRRMLEAFGRTVAGIQPWTHPVERSIDMLTLLTADS